MSRILDFDMNVFISLIAYAYNDMLSLQSLTFPYNLISSAVDYGFLIIFLPFLVTLNRKHLALP